MGRKKKRKQKNQSRSTQPKLQLSKDQRAALEEARQRLGTKNGKLVGYILTNEPLEDEWSRRRPRQVQEKIEEIHAIIRRRPKQAMIDLSQFIEKYPDAPILYNYLGAVYELVGDQENREAIVKKCYQKFPTYLFGQISYAQYCLEQGQVEKIPEIFGDQLDLKLLYPEREIFHISEYASFTGIIGWYYVLIGEQEKAERLYKALKRIAPRHAGTRRLKGILHPSLFVRFMRWLLKKMGAPESVTSDRLGKQRTSQQTAETDSES